MKRPSGSATAAIVVLFMLLLPVLYVLSIGPSHALVENEMLDVETHQAIYSPVVLAAYSCGADDWLFAYLDWWGGTNLKEERFGPIF